ASAMRFLQHPRTRSHGELLQGSFQQGRVASSYRDPFSRASRRFFNAFNRRLSRTSPSSDSSTWSSSAATASFHASPTCKGASLSHAGRLVFVPKDSSCPVSTSCQLPGL